MATASKTEQNTKLPGPEDRPGTSMVIFDGNCRICTGSVRILYRLDWGKKLSFLSLHDDAISQIAPDLTHDQMMKEMWVVDLNGRYHPGVKGIRYLSRRLVLLWIAVPVLHIPGTLPIWSWAYNKFASIRYRFGRNKDEDCGDACSIHFDR